MFTIENQFVKAVIQAKGAELTSLFSKLDGLEYMWSGDPAFWAKHSPVLFPIVGTLKNHTYFHKGKAYQLPRHGFAREHAFALEDQGPEAITFLLHATDETRKVFPFHFTFRIRYTVVENSLAVGYEVVNTGKEEMFFSVGAHPAFKVPVATEAAFEDYYLEFDHAETAPRWPVSPDGLITTTPEPFLNNTTRMPLKKEMFYRDALVVRNLNSSIVSLQSDHSEHGLRLDFPGFPFMGFWSAKNADFVCIEPWCGIADSVDANQQLSEKEGINRLQPGEAFDRAWTVTVF